MNPSDHSITAEDLLMLFQTTPDLVCIADKIGYFRNFNAAVLQTLGYSREELLSRPIADHMHPDDKEMTLNRRAQLLKGDTMVNFQNRYITKTGRIVWLEWTSVYLPERELVFAIAKNITSRKEMEHDVLEEFVKLKHQATQFKSTLEKDRKYVAAELHEDLAQLASAVKVDVDWINSNVNAAAEAKKRIDHALVSADLLIDTIRRISFSISPGMLDDLGLDATLDWYCNEFASSSGIACSFESSYNESLLSREVSLDFFRICQQVLSNVRQDVNADKVKIFITEKEGRVVLTIDGVKGEVMACPGAISIYERAASFGGKCVVKDNRVLVTT